MTNVTATCLWIPQTHLNHDETANAWRRLDMSCDKERTDDDAYMTSGTARGEVQGGEGGCRDPVVTHVFCSNGV